MELGRAEHHAGMDRRAAAPGRGRRTSGRQHDAVRNALGRDTKPHGGKKKSDDNGGEGVPDGVKQFSPKTPNTEATGTATNLATVEKPKKKSWDNGFDENIAKRFSAKRHVSLADLGEKMKIDTDKETKRFKQLIIGGHGNKDILATGSGDGPNTGDTLNLKATNKSTWLPFFNSSKFYGRAEIWILSCNVGSGKIPQLIADQSGSVVYAYTRTAYDDEKKPWASERGK